MMLYTRLLFSYNNIDFILHALDMYVCNYISMEDQLSVDITTENTSLFVIINIFVTECV